MVDFLGKNRAPSSPGLARVLWSKLSDVGKSSYPAYNVAKPSSVVSCNDLQIVNEGSDLAVLIYIHA